LSGAERHPIISTVGVPISEDEGRCGCLGKVGGLFAVKALVPAHDEIVGFDDL